MDPEALEHLDGTRGRMRIEVLEAWAGASVRIAVPRQLVCASCEGGGCDRCQRSGALRPPPDGSLSLRLPRALGEGVVVRVADPFGPNGTVDLLLIEVRRGDVAVGCCLVSISHDLAASPQPRARVELVRVALGVALLVVIILVLSLR